jgi:2-polyprenyl-6-methoxyphenol hydroxylase-like FAD-dependent oxidoreductase
VTVERFDVVVAGAGLPGLALASALARTGLRIALADRAPIATPDSDAGTWDTRIYAISPAAPRSSRASAPGRRCPASA